MSARKAAWLLTCACLLVPGVAQAQDNGGGAYPSAPAEVVAIACRSGCPAGAGSVVRVRGREMKGVRWVVFLGGPGPSDDVVAVVSRGAARWVDVRVPEGAPAGRLRLRKADGTPSRPSVPAVELTGHAPAAVPRGEVVEATVDAQRVFYAGGRDATLRYAVTAAEPVEVVVELVGGGTTLERWTPGPVAPGAEQRLEWDGTIGGRPAPAGRYAFRVIPVGARAAQGRAGEQVAVAPFRLLDHKFPVRGAHTFGEGGSLFGADRGARSHQGQDVFAACGTPLVAARGGRVVFKASDAKAGNYVVVRGEGNGVDYVYMHMTAPALVERGARVRTGQQLGTVGDSGNAVGCHVHFELWSPPGWYEGGEPYDPLPSLRAWDAMS